MNRRNFLAHSAALALIPASNPDDKVRWLRGVCKASHLNSILAEGGPGQRLHIRDCEIDCDEPLDLPQDAETVTIQNCRFTVRPGVSTAIREGVFTGPIYLSDNEFVWPTLTEAQTQCLSSKGLPT